MGDREEHSKPVPILAQAAQSPTESASLLRLDGEANESTPAPAHETPAATRIAPATARSDSAAFAFDLFVVHAEADAPFVHEYLLPALGLPADRVLLVDDLRPGEPLVAELERGVSRSRFTVPVLSPAYLRDQWAVFGEQLASFLSGENPRVIPLWLADCTLPLRVQFRVLLDFRRRAGWPAQTARLQKLLQSPSRSALDLDPGPPVRSASRRWALALLAGIVVVAVSLRLIQGPGPAARELPDWLAKDFVPTVHDAHRLGQDLATASGHYLEKQPSSGAVFEQQVSDLGFAIQQYNRSCRDFRVKSEVYRVKLAALGERELSLKEAGESLFEYAGSQFVETALPKVDANIPIEAQHQALAAHWREYETTSAGPLKRIASGLTRLETEMFRTAGLTRPDCPQPLVAHTALPTPVGAAAEQAARSLDDYAAALGNLARTVDAFSKAPIPDGGSLKAAATPLKAAINRYNAAYASVSARRLALTLQLLRMSPRLPVATSFVCALDGIEAYQLDQVNPLLNGLLVNVIAAWRDQATEETLADVRAQQQKEWRELRETLRLGAAAFSVSDRSDVEGAE